MAFSLLEWNRDTPIFAAEAAVVQDGKILLIRRADIGGWAFPGGFVDPAESVEQAAAREVREETGLEVEVVRLLGVYSRPRWRVAGVHHVAFLARPVGGTPTLSPETTAVEFFSPNQLPSTLFPWYRARIRDAFSADPSPVVRVEDVTWPSNEELLRLDRCLDDLRHDRLTGIMERWWTRWQREVAGEP